MATGFSRITLQSIEDFAAAMQINQIVMADDGSVTFNFERAGVMSFFPAQDGRRTLISLKRRPDHPLHTEDLEQFLQLARWDPYLKSPINAGMTADGGLILIASLDNNNFDLQAVENWLDRLITLHGETKIN